MRVLKIIGLVALVVIAAGLLVAAYFNYRAKHRPEFQQFAAASAPTTLPNGSYIGQAHPQDGWLGKTFDQASATGINRFKSGERYRFHMYYGPSLTAASQTVLKIDYNQSGNPFWLRFVVDEVVQTAPNQLLGKIQVNIIPHLTVTIGYFRLEQ